MYRLGIEPRKFYIRVLTPYLGVESNIENVDKRDIYKLCVVEDPIHVQKLFARELGDPAIDLGQSMIEARIENPLGAQQ